MLNRAVQLFEPCFRWTGRIDRRTFYGLTLLSFVPGVVLSAAAVLPIAMFAALLSFGSVGDVVRTIYPLVAPAFGIMLMSALIAQRSHDIGRRPTIFYGLLVVSLIVGWVVERLVLRADPTPGWIYVLLLLAVIPGPIAFFVLVFQPGQSGPNRFGPPPKP